jgi:O-antigen ligase
MFRHVLAICALLLISTLPLVHWIPGATWHDQQRIGQVIVMAAALILTIIPNERPQPPLLDAAWKRSVVVIAVAGALSALLARQPVWGFVEVALMLGSLGVAWLVAVTRRNHGLKVDRVLFGMLCFTCAGLVSRFLVSYLSAVTNGESILDAWLLLDGFSNPRFYGQFLTLAMPLLVVPLMLDGGLRRYAWPAGVLAVLAWTVAITSGTRGTWLGMAFAVMVLSCVGPVGRRWAGFQVAAAIIGLLLFWCAMTAVPQILGIEAAHHAAARLTSSLSRRDIIWKQAAETAVIHPFLGVGPMHLADLPNGVAAHPHQAFLQWAAEWGVLSALLVTMLVGNGARAVFVVLRRRRDSTSEEDVFRLCLAAAAVAALAQAMVDGVLVMPYSQLWVALLGGWLFGLQPPTIMRNPIRPARSFGWGAAFAASVAILSAVVVRDHPHLQAREEAFAKTLGGHYQPRFWAQGIINLGERNVLVLDASSSAR